MDPVTASPPVDEGSGDQPRQSRRRFLQAVAGAGAAATGLGAAAVAGKLGVLPVSAGSGTSPMADPQHPVSTWSDADIYRVRSAELMNGKPALADPVVYGKGGHEPESVGDPERSRLLALMGTLKRAWEYPALMNVFDHDPGSYLRAANLGSALRLNDDDIVRLLNLPASTDVGKLTRQSLASTLGLKAPQTDAPHVVFVLLRVLHVHPLIASDCK